MHARHAEARASDENAVIVVRISFMPFVLNPARKEQWARSRRKRLRAALQAPLVRLGLWCGFTHIDYAYIHGSKDRLHLGQRCSTMNTLFNVISGHIHVGDDTAFAHGCQVLTGEHRFFEGKRASFQAKSPYTEVPLEGNDIHIGERCFIGSGAIILKGVTIGDDVCIGAHSVVSKDLPSGCFAAGIPARVIPNGHTQGLKSAAPTLTPPVT
jgi:acetyltransferase-like isoleucine patch superfamily enzyme